MKKMIKKNKLIILIGLIALAIVGGVVMNFFDKRPFKFEDFETSESLKIFLERKYPIGSDGDIALKDLELAGAKCVCVKKGGLYFGQAPQGTEFIKECRYSTGFISMTPLKSYQIIIYKDKHNQLKEIWVAVHNVPN